MKAATNVKKIIESRGLKQSYIAEKVGLNPKTFNALLNGRKTFDVSFVVPICRALDITPNQLLGFETSDTEFKSAN